MKLRNLFLTAVAGILAFCGCDLFENDKPMLGITVEPDQVEIARMGGGSSIEIKTDQAWTITVPREADWLLVDPLSGTGTQYVNLYAETNNGKLRSATIIVKAGYDMVPVTVTQPGGIDSGDGLTMATAFTASEARYWINNNLASGEVTSTKYYVKGIIHKVQTTFEGSGTYGNATFFISDDGQASQEDFECYQIYYLGGRKWKSGDKEVAVGDDVIVYGPLTNYEGKPETAGKGAACLVKLNDEVVEPQGGQETGTGEPKGDGSADNPFNVSAALNAVKNLTWTDKDNYDKVGPYYIKGKVTEITENFDATATNGTQYGNATFYIADEGYESSTFYCYRVKYFDNKAWKTGDAPLLAVGDEVVICSELMNYRGNTPETVANAGYMIRINETTGGGGETPPGPGGDTVQPSGEGSLNSPFNVAAAVDAVKNLTWTANDNYEKVGPYYVKGKVSAISQNFDASGEYGNASFDLVDVDGSTTKLTCYRILYFNGQKYVAGQTPLPAVGSEVIVYSELMNYRGNTPETVANVGYVYSIDGVTEVGGETPPEPPAPNNPVEISISDFLAAEESSTQPYILVGTMANIANTTYGNFDLTDETGASVYVYGLTATDLGYGAKNDKSFASLGLAEGDKIKIIGYRGSFNDKIEVVYAYFVEKVGGGETPPTPPTTDPIEVSISEFNAAAESSTQKYILVGTMSNITSTTYGNFDLTDETGASVYVYGLTATDLGYGAKNDKSFANLGLAEGDKIKICGYRGSFNDKIEVVNAYFVEKVTGGDTPPAEETLTVSEILALQSGVACDSKPSLVVALTARGFVATDGTKNVYVYTQGTNFGGIAKIGDMVKFSGVKGEYNGVPQVATITSVEVVSSNNNVSYPNPKDITASAATYSATEAEFVSLTGTLAKSGNYYNITIDGVDAATKQGSIVYPVDDLRAAEYDGKKITVTGYFNGLSSQNKYINIIATKIEEVEQPGEATLTNVTASFTETQLSASWNTVQGADYYQWMLYKLTDDGQMESESYLAYGLTTHTSITSTIGRNTSASDNKEEWSVSSLVNGKYAVVVIAMSRQQGETQGTQIDMKAAGAKYYYNLKVSGLECKDGVVSASWKAYTGENLAFYRWQLQLIKPDGTRVDVAMGNITGTSINETIGQTWKQDENNQTAWYVTALEAGDYYFGVLACSSEGKMLEKSEGTDHFTYSGSSQNESRTVAIVISEYAAANNWTNATQYTSVQKDDVTLSVTGGGNTGKYYTSGTNWRLYQSESPTLTVSAGNYELVSVKIEYESVNTGVLTFDGSNLSSGQQVAFGSGIHRASYGVGNTGTATNGQVRITKVTVVIK
jgi:hypothetical protein